MKKIIISLLTAFFVISCVSAPPIAVYAEKQTKTSHCIADKALPDPACTPGVVLTTDIKKICTVGYTKTVRSVSTVIKKKVFQEYGISWSRRSSYEVDHLISLELGGSNDIANLFPESNLIKNGSRVKDAFENYLHKQVCAGKLSITEAQKGISSDWVDYSARQTAIKSSKPKAIVATPKEVPKNIPTQKESSAQPLMNKESATLQTSLPSIITLPTAPSQTDTIPSKSSSSESGSGDAQTIVTPTPQPVPAPTVPIANPSGASARCKDGTYSYSTNRRGTCSGHGGVSEWY